jgi:hypothetical protein
MVLNSQKSIFTVGLDYFLKNESSAHSHTSSKPVDVLVKNVINALVGLDLTRKALPELTSKIDPLYHIEDHLNLRSFFDEVKVVSGTELWGSTTAPSLCTPVIESYRKTSRVLREKARQEWSPYHYSVGCVIGNPMIWGRYAEFYKMNTSTLPVVTPAPRMSGDILSKTGAIQGSDVLISLPMPNVFKSEEFRMAELEYPESIHFYPMEIVQATPTDMDIIHLDHEEDTLTKRLARLLVGDLRTLNISNVKRHPNSKFFFSNLKSAGDVESLKVRYPNSLPVYAPTVTNLRHAYVMRVPDISDVSMPFTMMVKNPLLKRFANDSTRLNRLMDNLIERSGYYILPRTSIKIFEGKMSDINSFAKEIEQYRVNLIEI